MADLKKTIEILFEGNDQASRKAADVLGKIREMEAQAKATSASTDGVAKSLDDIGKKDAMIARAADAMKALAAALVVDRFIDANVQFERFERAFKAIQGAGADAGAEFEYIKNVSNALGISIGVAADSYIKLTAATKGTALEGQATRTVFEAVARATSALSLSTSDTEGVMRALTQIVSKGKVSMEELRGQIGDRLPGAFQIAADAMGLTTAQLDKLVTKGGLTAEEFLPKFAAQLDKTFGGASFDGYVQSMQRLRNEIDIALIDVGKAGAFDILIGAVNATTATLTGAISIIRLFGETMGNIAYTLASRDFLGFAERFKESLDKAAASTRSLPEALGIVDSASKKAGDSGAAAGKAISAEMEAAKVAARELGKNAAEVDKTLKDLGINPDKIKKPVDDLIALFEKLVNNPAVRGDQILAGLAKTIKDVKDSDGLAKLGADIVTAFAKGKLSADEFAQASKLLDDAQAKLAGTLPKTKAASEDQAKAMAKQAEETRKAEENAKKFQLEMEKLASNERIKNIEAKVKLNIAEIEAQTKRAEAAFESINTTVNSTGDLLGDLFGALKDYDTLSFRASGLIEKQIDLENGRRQEALDLQKKLVEAQIASLRAQARQYEKGDSLIKIDGAGLQPHLEAFMWEILRQIQIRVNSDGLKLLLGV